MMIEKASDCGKSLRELKRQLSNMKSVAGICAATGRLTLLLAALEEKIVKVRLRGSAQPRVNARTLSRHGGEPGRIIDVAGADIVQAVGGTARSVYWQNAVTATAYPRSV